MPRKSVSSGAAGCLSLAGFCLSPVAGSTLAMPATALYLARHHPAELDRSDHWLLFACLALPLAGLIAWWSARRRGRIAMTVTVRAVTLLVAAFVVTLGTLEHYAVPVELLGFVPILTGWAGILIFLILIPLLNRAFPVPPSAAPVRQRSRSRLTGGPSGSRSSGGYRPRSSAGSRSSSNSRSWSSRSSSNSRSSSGSRASGNRAPTGQRSSSGQRHRPRRTESPRSDGRPQYRQPDGKPERGDGTPRYRDDAGDRPARQPSRPEQGDGKPRYRTDPAPPPRRPTGDGKPVYRDD